MTENQNPQTVSKNQNGNQSKEGQSNQKKEGNPSEKNTGKEDEENISVPAEDSKEQEPRKHPHEISVPVVTKEDKSSL